ncbi:ETX/MTX2 family pore-forming toxin [Embleya sp. NPDC059237]|uniref:ETX/MTX2 family pore-forming toxin n=1 Tax=Embleya sp. NPDC059237 TaxID=3346784 RepID=UPI00369F3DDF
MSFHLHVAAAKNKEHCKAFGSGKEIHHVTDKEAKSFRLTGSTIKEGFGKILDGKPDHVYWSDEHYKTFGWTVPSTTLILAKSEIIGIDTKPVIVKDQTFTNDSTKAGEFNASVQDSVTCSVSDTWTQSNRVDVGQTFNYQVEFLGTGGGGSTQLTYSHEWGHSKTETKDITVGSQSGVSVTLQPHQSVVAELSASRGTLKARFTFHATVSGDLIGYFNDKHKGHWWWCAPINEVLQWAKLPTTLTITQEVDVDYYCNGEVRLKDKDNKLLAFFPFGVRAGEESRPM